MLVAKSRVVADGDPRVGDWIEAEKGVEVEVSKCYDEKMELITDNRQLHHVYCPTRFRRTAQE